MISSKTLIYPFVSSEYYAFIPYNSIQSVYLSSDMRIVIDNALSYSVDYNSKEHAMADFHKLLAAVNGDLIHSPLTESERPLKKNMSNTSDSIPDAAQLK